MNQVDVIQSIQTEARAIPRAFEAAQLAIVSLGRHIGQMVVGNASRADFEYLSKEVIKESTNIADAICLHPVREKPAGAADEAPPTMLDAIAALQKTADDLTTAASGLMKAVTAYTDAVAKSAESPKDQPNGAGAAPGADGAGGATTSSTGQSVG